MHILVNIRTAFCFMVSHEGSSIYSYSLFVFYVKYENFVKKAEIKNGFWRCICTYLFHECLKKVKKGFDL